MKNLKHKTGCYLASGWFDADQEETRQIVIRQLEKHEISYFSPKDESLCPPDAVGDTQQMIFDGNIKAIEENQFMICNTAGKDMGTIFEAGHAYAIGKPIIYFWRPPAHVEKPQLNLMLARSGVAACMSEDELDNLLSRLVENNFDFNTIKTQYTGEIE